MGGGVFKSRGYVLLRIVVRHRSFPRREMSLEGMPGGQDQESGRASASPQVECSVSKQRAQRSGQMRLRMLRGSMTVP